jgi:hypothetical protein
MGESPNRRSAFEQMDTLLVIASPQTKMPGARTPGMFSNNVAGQIARQSIT